MTHGPKPSYKFGDEFAEPLTAITILLNKNQQSKLMTYKYLFWFTSRFKSLSTTSKVPLVTEYREYQFRTSLKTIQWGRARLRQNYFDSFLRSIESDSKVNKNRVFSTIFLRQTVRFWKKKIQEIPFNVAGKVQECSRTIPNFFR